jgi:Spy/CpxP family protein refolding chaperone
VNAGAWRGFALTLVIAIVAGFAGARLGMLGQHRSPAGGAPYASVRQAVDDLLERDFKLTAAQKQQIAQIDQRFSVVHNQIWTGIYTENAQLANAVAANMTLSPDAKKAIAGIQDGVGRLHTESIIYVLEIRQVLTPAQRPDFDEHVIMALMRSP